MATKKLKTVDAATPHELRANTRKWGSAIVKAGWTFVPNMLIERQRALGLDATDLNILLHLLSFWWEPDNKPHPSKRTIAAAMQLDPRTIQRRIAAMETAGLLRRESRGGKERGTQTNRYHFDGLIKELTPFAHEELKAREERATKRARKGLRLKK